MLFCRRTARWLETFCLLAKRDILSPTGGRKVVTPQVGSRMTSTIEACSCLLRREGRRSQTDAGRTFDMANKSSA
jgi:hypothetical protein